MFLAATRITLGFYSFSVVAGSMPRSLSFLGSVHLNEIQMNEVAILQWVTNYDHNFSFNSATEVDRFN